MTAIRPYARMRVALWVVCLVAAGCFAFPGNGGLGDDDDVFGDDDSSSGDDDTGGSGDDDTGGSGDDDSGGSGDDDTGGSGDDDTGGSGDDDTGGSGDDDTGGSGDDDVFGDDDTANAGGMWLTAPQGTGFPSNLIVGQTANLPFRIHNGSEVYVLTALLVDVTPNNGPGGTIFLVSGGSTTGSISPLTYQERTLDFSPQAAVSYSAVVQLFHQGTNLDESLGVGPDGVSCLFDSTCTNPSANDDIPATLTFTVAVLGGSESECSDGLDNDGDGPIDCADSDCDTICPCGEDGCCDDGIDNEIDGSGTTVGDGAIDCADSDCSFDPACLDFCCSPGGDENTYTLCLEQGCVSTVCATGGLEDCCSPVVGVGGWVQGCFDAYTACGNCP